MTFQEIYEYVEPLLQTEMKYRDWQEMASELGFDASEQAYDDFCQWVDNQ